MSYRNNDQRHNGRRSSDSRRPQVRIPWARLAAFVIGIGCWIRAAFVAAAGENNYTGTPWTEIFSLLALGLVFIGFGLFARWLMTTSWDRKARDIDSLIQNVFGMGIGFQYGAQNAAHKNQDARETRNRKATARAANRPATPAAPAPQPQQRHNRPAPQPQRIAPPPAQPRINPRDVKLAAAAQVIAEVHARAIQLDQNGQAYRLVEPSIEGLMSDIGRTLPVIAFRYTLNGTTVTGDECPNLIRAGRRAARQALLEMAGPSGILYTPQNYQAIQKAWSRRVQVLVD